MGRARLAHPAAKTQHLSLVLFGSKSPPSWLQSPQKLFLLIFFHLLELSLDCSSEVGFSWEQFRADQLSLCVKSMVELEALLFE